MNINFSEQTRHYMICIKVKGGVEICEKQVYELEEICLTAHGPRLEYFDTMNSNG